MTVSIGFCPGMPGDLEGHPPWYEAGHHRGCMIATLDSGGPAGVSWSPQAPALGPAQAFSRWLDPGTSAKAALAFQGTAPNLLALSLVFQPERHPSKLHGNQRQ